MKFAAFLFVILFAGVASAQYYTVDGYVYQPRVVYQAVPVYTPHYYSAPVYYDYGTGRYVSASERAWLDRRAVNVISGRYPAPPLFRGLRLWVNLTGN